MWQHFSLDSIAPAPWRNGGGQTLPLACWPPGAGLEDFDWRVSIATIASDGPFSVFAGVDRLIMLLEGAGMRLHADDGRVDARIDQPLRPFAFAGDVPLHCQLLAGPTQDFNVMVRRPRGGVQGGWRARVHVHRPQVSTGPGAVRLPPSPHGLLLAWRGQWRLPSVRSGQAPPAALQPGQGLWWAGAAAPPALATLAAHASDDASGGAACLIQVCLNDNDPPPHAA